MDLSTAIAEETVSAIDEGKGWVSDGCGARGGGRKSGSGRESVTSLH